MAAQFQKTLYLGNRRPLLHEAVEHLWETHPPRKKGRKTSWDLSALLLVLPTARSRRRVIERLQHHAGRERVGLVRPIAITIGELPPRLFETRFKIATELERTLAWSQALAETPDQELSALLSNLPPREPLTPWIELASTIGSLHDDLAAGELSFADVQREVSGDAEQKRWKLLSELHQKYITRLRHADRIDPSIARVEAIASDACTCPYEIILIGTSDVSRSIASLLRALPMQVSIIALVAANETDRDHFDSFGSVIASRWATRELPLRDDHLVSAQDVSDQAEKSVAEVKRFRSHAPRSGLLFDVEPVEEDRLTVGVTDESLVGPIEFELRASGLQSHREIGWTITQTPTGRLLELLTEHLSRNTWRSLAALVRHADVYEFVDRQQPVREWLTSLDGLISNHYPTRCDLPIAEQAAAEYKAAVAVRDLVQSTLRDLRGAARTLSDWAGRIAAWLTVVMDDKHTASEAEVAKDEDNEKRSRSAQAFTSTVNFLSTIQSLESTLDVKVPAASAIEMLMSRLSKIRVADTQSEAGTTIAGWLDLALDDSPSMVITSLNHPYVPESVTADPFLPGSLRTRLQLNDNERRFARDVHALEVILSCRANVKIIVGTRSLDGSPTPPSRLLAAAKPIDAARRIVQLLEPHSEVLNSLSTPSNQWSGRPGKTLLPIPVLPQGTTVPRMSVTAFKDYLICPYRFYLRHVLYLRPLDDASAELQANQFGDLIHNTLDWFGKSELKDSTSVSSIEDGMHETLDRYATSFFGSSPSAAVRLQIEQARRRLSHVAVAQSERRQAGWKIDSVETPFGEEQKAGITVDEKQMPIRGRIDRIDRHEDGRWAIIDYKTHGHPPRKKHLYYVGEQIHWTDLQLPLYQKLIEFVIGKDVDKTKVALSYFNIGDNLMQTKVNDADFSEKELKSATSAIEDCVRQIRLGDFAASKDVQFDDYSMILQTGAVATLFEQLTAPESEVAS